MLPVPLKVLLVSEEIETTFDFGFDEVRHAGLDQMWLHSVRSVLAEAAMSVFRPMGVGQSQSYLSEPPAHPGSVCCPGHVCLSACRMRQLYSSSKQKH